MGKLDTVCFNNTRRTLSMGNVKVLGDEGFFS